MDGLLVAPGFSFQEVEEDHFLTREETILVAHIARYHRRSGPKASHPEYMRLPREQRMIVSKLAAILRVADALDRAHLQRLRNLEIRRESRQIVLVTDGAGDPTLERRVLANKAGLFTDIYGLTVEIAQRPRGGRDPQHD